LCNIVWFTLIRQTKSIQEAVLYSPSIERSVVRLIRESEPDVIVYDTIRMGQFRRAIGAASAMHVLYLEDLLSERYSAILAASRRWPEVRIDALGNFARQLPRIAHVIVSNGVVQRLLLQFERRLVQAAERGGARLFDRCLLLNEAEVATLQREAGVTQVAAIRPWLGQGATQTRRAYDARRPEFVFLGALNYAPNHLSLMRFMATQVEAIRKVLPEARLRIIGRGAGSDLLQLAATSEDRVSVEGFVENLEEVLRSACALVAPLLFGSGVKLKVLEALAHGLPVITTDCGVAGIPLGDASGCIVENDLARYAMHMRNVAEEGVNQALSQQARAFYEGHYSTAVLTRQYDAAFMRSPGIQAASA
jgi:glycosyltransferase involved in cell wall biosynthesis